MIFKTRLMVSKYIPEIAAIDKKLYLNDHWGVEDYTLCLSGDRAFGIVCTINEKAIAYCLTNRNKYSLEIVRGGVDTKYQRNGVGTYLVNYFKKRCVERGLDSIRCSVDERMLGTALFFKKLGFRANLIRINSGVDYYSFRHYLDKPMKCSLCLRVVHSASRQSVEDDVICHECLRKLKLL